MSTSFKTASRLYVVLTPLLGVGATSLLLDIIYFHPGPLSLRQTLFCFLFLILALYAQLVLRDRHLYYRGMINNGCLPPTLFGSDPFGISFFLDSVRAVRRNDVLQTRVRMFRSLGHTYQTKLFPAPEMMYNTDEPENIKAILSTRFEDWGHTTSRIEGFLPILGRHSIFTVDGPEWKHSRATLRPAFVRNLISDFECLDRHINKAMKKVPTDGSRVDLQSIFSMLTIDTISEFMFGQSTDLLGSAPEAGLRFGAAFDDAIYRVALRDRLGWISRLFADQTLDKHVAFMRAYVDQFIHEVKEKQAIDNSKKYTFLQELIRMEEPDEVVRDQLMAIIIAGRDTTTSVLSYLFYELSRRPDILKRTQREIQDLGVENPSWEQLKDLTYLNWTIKEALRLNPPVPVNARQAVKDTILPRGGGANGSEPLFISKGSTCRWFIWCTQRRKDLYGDDAEEFKPERWETMRPGFEYLPFNGGPRICIGQQFALIEIALITFRMLQTFKTIELADDRPMLLKFGVNISLENGCWVKATKV